MKDKTAAASFYDLLRKLSGQGYVTEADRRKAERRQRAFARRMVKESLQARP